ncbi:putative ribonuclease H protein [Citrus sinensis]|uniref:Ribonuclease H protein n=1 Tax=Citrus sinensis TaxID=2711 RepID=A0ACB8NYZ9_CITSI|nr:putative ribonuclease H protein [Citrus sinensis]
MKDQSGAAEMNEGVDDLDIADEDVIIEIDGRIPSVVFSQKMQEQLVRPWKNTVIVKLLGRSIGYRSLCTKLESLWRVERGFTVIDLENDYYLVRFGIEEDVEFALTQGPWTIFGHYLTVQKWSPSFDCLSDKIETVVAWIRLPGMPLHYYHKRVLRILGEVEVPRGQGCDGVYQPEGEATGVTVDPANVENPKNSLFGPWMIVAKKGRPRKAKEGTIPGDYNRAQNGNARSGSRFSLLNSENNRENEREISERIPSNHALEINLDLQDENQHSNQPMQPNHRYSLRKHSQRSNRGNVTHPPSPSLVQLRSSPPHVNHADQKRLLSLAMHIINPTLASIQNQSVKTRDNQPHLASTSVDPLKYSVYSFANPPNGADMLTQFARANPLFPNMTKDNRNNPLGEPPDNGGWNGISEDEDSEGSTYVARGSVDKSRDDSESGGSLEEETDMELELQAHTLCALAPEFRRTFKALIQKYNPSMVALFEQRISGKKADEFIIRSGFERSHRIEAEGFSGERRGGLPRSNGVCHRFSDWFHRNQFCDLDFSGPKFTWERGNLLKRLDRSFCNDEWVQKFANSQVMHLPKLDSDHRPILVKFDRVSRQASGAKPFQFLASWLTDSRFRTFVFETWRESGDYVNLAGHFITEVRKWNKEVFGYIHKRKNNILERLAGIQRALEWHRSRHLMELEVTLKRELESILSQEEILWRRQNQIVMLKDEHGNWIEDVDIIKAHAVTFFKDLYTKEPGEHIPYLLVSMFPRVNEINLGKLNAEVCEDDIREAIFSMHPLKAPGVNGLHAVFYQTQWDIVGVSKSGKIGQMVIKVELEKSYDRLSWDFIFETLCEARIPSDLIHITMDYITSASMQILLNGKCTEEFIPSRGIRQGDPISPYIFVLCIERLSHRIHRAVNTGTWRLIRLSKRGGLGLKNLTLMNEALLMKLGWGLLVNSNNYWAQVLCSKYGFDPNTMSTSLPTKYGSYLWKAIGRIWPKVADATSVDGLWNWGRFGFLLPHNVVLMIAAIKPPSPDSEADQFYWGSSNLGMFTARTVYNLLLGNLVQDEEVRWKSIWKWRGPHRIWTFLWLAAKERIKCKAELYRRHIGVDMTCMRCGDAVEDTVHALRDCATSKRIWNMLLTGHETASFFTLPTHDWIFANIQGMGNHGSNREWSCIFGVAIWCIWVARNQLLFEDKVANVESIVRDIRVRAEEIIHTSEVFQSDRKLRVQKMFGWLPPRWPYYKLNFDGARKGSGLTGAEGLIRDATGRWSDFGLQMGLRLLVVEIDSLCITQLLHRKSFHATLPLVNDILGLLSRDWQVSVHHVYREANFAADFMASHALTLPLGLHYFTTPPLGVKTWLQNDGLGTMFPRVFKP